ncbi:MAG TPA: putrescine aminotransferase [Candidatus Limnocylindrales bacterium]|nr:putrescine aminotransferase [Candidatus Limnocylindrales bacterium]
MNYDIKEILSYSEKVLDFIAKKKLSDDERDWVANETLIGFRDHYNPGFLEYRKSVSTNFAAVEWEDSGTGFTDIYGRKFIDCLGGYGIYNVGHRHPRVVAAVKNQLDRQALHSQELLDPLRAMLAKLVAMITPGDLQFSFFTNSGTESIEGALKLARMHTGRPGIIAAVGGFHGKSLGSLSATAKAVFRKPYLPLLPYFQHVPFGDADMLRKTIASSFAVGHEIAAVILEPIQGEGGVVVPPDDYFVQVRDICDEYGVLLIADEVQTGMGRTGKLFAMEHYGVIPDILCLGKAFGGGVMPIGAFVSTEKIWQKMMPNPFMHTTTFGGNPIACAAAIAGIQVILDEGLVGQAAEKGNYLLPKLQKLSQKYPILKEARGRGLLIGLEFINDETGYKVAKGLFENGVLVAGTLISAVTIRIEPALTISINEIDTVLEILDSVLKQISNQ